MCIYIVFPLLFTQATSCTKGVSGVQYGMIIWWAYAGGEQGVLVAATKLRSEWWRQADPDDLLLQTCSGVPIISNRAERRMMVR